MVSFCFWVPRGRSQYLLFNDCILESLEPKSLNLPLYFNGNQCIHIQKTPEAFYKIFFIWWTGCSWCTKKDQNKHVQYFLVLRSYLRVMFHLSKGNITWINSTKCDNLELKLQNLVEFWNSCTMFYNPKSKRMCLKSRTKINVLI